MKIAERLAGDITIMDVQGKILFGNGDQAFRDAINKVIDSGRLRLVLNMAEVPYVDSAGISELVRAYVTLSKRAGTLKLLSLTRKVQDLLAIAKLLTVFEAFESEEEAVDSFGQDPPTA